jgi:hypothetical protein
VLVSGETSGGSISVQSTPSTRKIHFDFPEEIFADGAVGRSSKGSSPPRSASEASNRGEVAVSSDYDPILFTLWRPEFQIPRSNQYQVGDMKKIFDLIDTRIQEMNLSSFDLKDFLSRN